MYLLFLTMMLMIMMMNMIMIYDNPMQISIAKIENNP